MSDKIKREAIAYARSVAEWWRGAAWPRDVVSDLAREAAEDAQRVATPDDWGGRAVSMEEIARSWDLAADLLEKPRKKGTKR